MDYSLPRLPSMVFSNFFKSLSFFFLVRPNPFANRISIIPNHHKMLTLDLIIALELAQQEEDKYLELVHHLLVLQKLLH